MVQTCLSMAWGSAAAGYRLASYKSRKFHQLSPTWEGQLETTDNGPGCTKAQERGGVLVSQAALQPPVPTAPGVEGSSYPWGTPGAARWPRASNQITKGWGCECGLYWDWANEASGCVPPPTFSQWRIKPTNIATLPLEVFLQKLHNFIGELIQWFLSWEEISARTLKGVVWIIPATVEGRDTWLLETIALLSYPERNVSH